jgi:hypothetical protein
MVDRSGPGLPFTGRGHRSGLHRFYADWIRRRGRLGQAGHGAAVTQAPDGIASPGPEPEAGLA